MAHNIRNRIFKFGNLQSIVAASVPADMWGHVTSLYPFQSNPIGLAISSSDNGDVIPIMMEGLDANGLIAQQQTTLTGQTPKNIDGSWIRQYIGFNDNEGTDFDGTVYIAEQGDSYVAGVPQTADKIKIVIKPEFQRTMMLVYTTPRNYVSRLKNLRVGIVPKNAATAFATAGIYTRSPGGSFTNQGYTGLITDGTSVDNIDISGMPDLDPFTDVVIRVIEASADGIELQGSFNIDFTRLVEI